MRGLGAVLRVVARGRILLLGVGSLALVVGGYWIAFRSPGAAVAGAGAALIVLATAEPRLSRRFGLDAPRRPVDAETVEAAYRFLLGRHPESPAALASKLGTGLSGLLAQLLLSDEYESRLVAPVLRGAGPSGGLFDAPPDDRVLAWAAETLPLEPPSRQRLRQVADWTAAHAVILSDPRLRAAVPGLESRLPAARTEALAAAGAARGVTAEIEDVGPGWVRGFALDRSSPGTVVQVELWIDGVFSAAQAADLYRRDLEERFGASGVHGFLFAHVGAERADPRPFRVEVRDAGTGQALGATRVAPYRDGRDRRIGKVESSLRAARRSLAEATEALDRMAIDRGFTVDSYDAYWRSFASSAPAPAPSPSEGRAGPRFDVLVAGSILDRPAWEATEQDLALQTGSVHGLRRALAGEAAPELTGDYVWIVDAGDRVPADALRRLADAAHAAGAPGWMTFDSDELDPKGRHVRPVFRPAFDPELLLQTPYLGPSAVVRTDLLRRALSAGGSLRAADRADLWLRVLELAPEGPTHVPRVLLHRREHADEVGIERYADDVGAHLQRLGSAVEVRGCARGAADGGAPSWPRVQIAWPLPAVATAAVIVPTRDQGELLRACLASLERSRPENRTRFDVLVVDNGSSEPAALQVLQGLADAPRTRVLRYDKPFNWSAINNFAAAQTSAEVLVFLNNDTAAITPDWCDALCAQALRPEVGAVGARLLFADGSVQHAGVILGTAGAVAAHEGAGEPSSESSYLGRRALAHRCAAVTGACLATRRVLFDEVGGFDEVQLGVEANDIDYCLRVRSLGLAVLYEPAATLYHFESRSRGHTGFDAGKRARADDELQSLRRRWGAQLDHDPFYNLHFDRRSAPFTRLGAPPEPGVQGYSPVSPHRRASV